MATSFEIRTTVRSQFVEITDQVQQFVKQSKKPVSAVVVSSTHTTAGITIQENADPDVVHDVLLWLNEHIPKSQPGFRHAEGNSDSHLKTMLVGTSVTVPVQNGDLILGTWQGIYFCEFDGPRTRTVHVTLLS